MKIDMHCHIAAEIVDDYNQRFTEVYHSAINDELILDIGTKEMKNDLVKKYNIKMTNGQVSGQNYLDLIYDQLTNSKNIDGVVLLAMDGIYSPFDRQRPDIAAKRPGMEPNEYKNKFYKAGTEIIVTNQYTYNQVKKLNEKLGANNITNKKFYWGASINPNRDQASLAEERKFLEDLQDNKPVLMKWIPSYHHIDLDDPYVQDSYDWMRNQNLPLLCHVGPEFAYSESYKRMNKPRDNFRNLIYPLEAGLNVIAPHCVSPFFILDPDHTDQFIQFMNYWNHDKNHANKLWVDNSGTCNPTTFLGVDNSLMFPRVSRMRKYAKKFPKEYMLYGTDFPVPIADDHSISKVPNTTKEQERKTGGFPWPHVSEEFYNELIQVKNRTNFWDLDSTIKEHYGYAEETFTNAVKVLRLD